MQSTTLVGDLIATADDVIDAVDAGNGLVGSNVGSIARRESDD